MRFLGLLIFLLLHLPSVADAAKLKPEAAQAYDRYVEIAEAEASASPASEQGHRGQARAGEIVLHDSGSSVSVPGALIHDWTGTIFVPDIHTEDVVSLLREFDRHRDVYPDVIDSAVVEVSDDRVRGRWQLLKKKFTTVVMNVDMSAEYLRFPNDRWFVASRSTRIAEVKNAGTPNETEVEPGKQKGFLWRLNAYWWVEKTDDGVFVECRTISLTRKAPTGLGWLVKPMIEEAPRESLVSTLEGTRGAFSGAVARSGD